MLKFRNRRVAGFSLIELLIVIAIIMIILAMAVPRLGKARMHALETGAVKSITTIHTAQAQYYSTFGKYAESLTALGPPVSGSPNASAAELISGDLASGDSRFCRDLLAHLPVAPVSPSCSSARSAADCSASFLFNPEPLAVSSPATPTSIQNVLRWSGPVSRTTRYRAGGRPRSSWPER